MSGHLDKPVFKVRAKLRKYKMKLWPVWGPRLCDEARFVGSRGIALIRTLSTGEMEELSAQCGKY